jgi:FAD/FMN-containing dehydrogenase
MLEKMNKVLGVDKEKKQMKVQAQMTLKNLYDAADAANLSTPRSALPWWQGLTLGGVFATSSHGTGNNVTHMIVSVTDWLLATLMSAVVHD